MTLSTMTGCSTASSSHPRLATTVGSLRGRRIGRCRAVRFNPYLWPNNAPMTDTVGREMFAKVSVPLVQSPSFPPHDISRDPKRGFRQHPACQALETYRTLYASAP